MRLSVNQNNGNTYMAKNIRRWNFFSKFLTQNPKKSQVFTQNPKKYQIFTDDYFFGFSISMGGGARPPLDTRMQQYFGARACRLTRMQQYFGT